MKPTKKIEAAVLDVYHKWLHSYLNGDVKTYDSYFDNAFHFIGSTDNEEFLNRKDTTNFFKVTAEQLSGKSQVRNETKIVEQFGELIIITHLFDAWFLNGEDWNYYGRFRFSNILEQNKDGWHFVYQHYSTPDGKAEDGETIGLDQISKENIELREAIKRRTIELEEKNRELEIEGALERIRAKALAMNASEDLLDVVVTLRTEFLKLGHEAQYFWHMMWLPDKYDKAMTSGDGTRIGMVMELPRHIHGEIPMLANWEKSTDPMVIYAMDTEAAIDYVDKIIALGNFQQVDPQAPTHDDIRHIGGLTFIMARTTHGEIGYSLPGVVAHPPKEDLEILVKFAGAFDLAHRRFLDLQKSEKQAREVQIELALEWVRARTMAMQKSEELADVATILFQQVKELGIQQWTCGFNIWEIGDTEFTFYPGGPDGEILPSCKVPLLEHPIFKQFDESKRRGDELFVYEKEGEIQKDHYKYMHSLPGIGDMLQGMLDSGLEFPEYQIDHVVNFAYGNMIFITYEPLPEMHNVFKRFAKVFEQTYTRFLDLQKAEAQARESQIEAALEKVRSRSLAMHKSEELREVVLEIHKKFQQIDISMESRVAVIVVFDEDSKNYNQWIASDDISNILISTPYFKHRVLDDFWNAKEAGIDFYSGTYTENEKNTYFQSFFEISHYTRTPEIKAQAEWIYDQKFYAYSPVFQKNSSIGIADFSGIPLTHDEIDIIKRFSKVFEQAYIRFLDLQKAEAQTREARIENALERVRSRTMAMQHSNELPEAANDLFLQVQELGIPAWSAGYCIWTENKKEATAFMSSEGIIQKPFILPNVGVGYDFDKPLLNGETFHIGELGGELIKEHYEFMRKLPVFGEVIDGILKAGHPLPSFQIFHICYFKYGYVMFITYERVPKSHDIFKRFATVFEQTYTRFLDLQVKEEQATALLAEKKRLEDTLSNLQTTQKQLIQSEKMASLGELTAGIAHEIQNPLNFVNNFSEVSNELIDEMNDELDKGDLEEVKAISLDIKQNLEKINHHGKRADNIVKGMLQHSRSSSGTKEPTDINALADEYLRLAYHGLRAKDKSFNAELVTDFDEHIGKVNMIPQDMGRVILNLITNAFYAVNEKKQQKPKDYKPTVSVSTKRVGDKIEIKVTDNGNGIPKHVIDKVFQPFFTTKPTGQGTGLGLSMSYDIVTKGHGGELHVETIENERTQFNITLPVYVTEPIKTK
ncbi:ATP-binding protein [uncultured Maribacter sp.]|uniref:ATP-binding protein n=1 Tax=uncultured Maribacter sp. TaxID=431308 RepID=UPI0030EC621F|tara:strand:- start:3344 stop:6979 length:3636 start_codon:yes stop_codon:yes gene_type:complete